MLRIVLTTIIVLSLMLSSMPPASAVDSEELHRSVTWTQRLFEENSLTASLLYWPNFFLSGFVRAAADIIHYREHPYVTVPPPAHQASR